MWRERNVDVRGKRGKREDTREGWSEGSENGEGKERGTEGRVQCEGEGKEEVVRGEKHGNRR